MAQKKTEVAKWQERINLAKKEREPRLDMWKKSVELYEADDSLVADGELQEPFVFSILSTALSALFSQMPRFSAIPMAERDLDKSDLVEAILRDVIIRTDLEEDIKKVVFSALVMGTGFAKVGFKVDTKDVQEGTELEPLTKEIVTEELVWVEHIRNDRILIDPEAEKFESAKYVVHIIPFTREEFEKKYGKGLVKEESFIGPLIMTDLKNGIISEDLDRIKVYEIWDKPKRERIVIAEGGDKILERFPWAEKMTRYPFEILSLIPKEGSIYGFNDVYLFRHMATVINDMLNKQEDSAQKAKSGIITGKGALDDPEKDAFKNAGTNFVVEANNADEITPIQTPPLPQETFVLRQEMKSLGAEIFKVSAQQRQASQPGEQTATEVNAIAQAGNLLTADKARSVERFIERLISKVVIYVKEFYTIPRTARVTSDAKDVITFQEWQGSDLGEYAFEVVVGSAKFQNEGLQNQQIMQALQMIQGFSTPAPTGGAIIKNPEALIKPLLKKAFTNFDIPQESINKAFEAPQQLGLEGTGVPQDAGGVPAGGNLPSVPTPNQTAPSLAGLLQNAIR